MSEGINRVMLLGNLGADPELRVGQNGSSILKLRVATSEFYKDKEGKGQERTEWHSVTVFGPRGEALSKFLKKGERVFVEGRLQTSSYEKDGQKRYSTDIIANNIVLNGTGRKERDTDPAPAPTASGNKPDSVVKPDEDILDIFK